MVLAPLSHTKQKICWEIWKKWVRIALFSLRIAAEAMIAFFWPVIVSNLISKYSIASTNERICLYKEMHEYLVVEVIIIHRRKFTNLWICLLWAKLLEGDLIASLTTTTMITTTISSTATTIDTTFIK